MLNTDGNEDFNKLIKDVDKIIAYIAQGNSNVTTKDYNGLIQSLENDQFEVLVKAKYDGALIQVMAQFSGEDSKFVVAVLSGNDFALMEMHGELDLRYLTAFKDVDFMQLSEYILSQDGDPNNEQEGQPEEKTEEKTE